jgi:hypothetical protein
VYATPTTQNQNYTLSQTYTVTQSIAASAAGAPGPIDVHNVYAYTVTHDPGTGTVPISETSDTYRGVKVSGLNQTVSSYGQNVTLIQNDETSADAGGGPYTMTTTTASAYPTPIVGLTYPLQTGAVVPIPDDANETIAQTDVNAANGAPPNAKLNFGETEIVNSDGSFTFTKTFPAQGSDTRTETSSGTGTDVATSPTSTVTETIGLPVAGAIPVSVTTAPVGGAPATHVYAAADWYPNGTVSSPLALETMTVIGPTAALPAQCDGSIAEPSIVEVDERKTTLDIFGTITQTVTRLFISNGLTVCNLGTTTSTNYTVSTGAPFSTNATTSIQVLASTTFVNAASRLRAGSLTRSIGSAIR